MLPEPTLNSYMMLGAVLCAIGAAGVFRRRHLLTVLLSAGIMLVGVVVTLVAADQYLGRAGGQVLALLVIVVAGLQFGLGLALATACVRQRHSLDPDEVTELRW